MRILIADDDGRRRNTLVSHFVEKGIAGIEDIEEVDCVDAAKALLERSFFDALILDVVLPKRHKGTPSKEHGLALLGQLTRSNKFKQPDRIIGITAYLEDIQSYRDEFSKYCMVVLEANDRSVGWRTRVSDALSYATSSRLTRAVTSNALHAVTIHGIRTFGEWQNRLKALARLHVGNIPFHSYKYGYFPTLSFLAPFMRKREVKRLAKRMSHLFENHSGSEFVIFSHSCGTFLIVEALKILIVQGKTPVRTLVLCGSVLRKNYDLRMLQAAGITIVNECADHDYVLWFSEAAVLGTGMAGKTGFYGFQDAGLINRFFRGGHSSYFDGHFMQKYWMPLFDVNAVVSDIDERESSTMMHEFAEKIVSAFGFFKPMLYSLFFGYCVLKIAKVLFLRFQ